MTHRSLLAPLPGQRRRDAVSLAGMATVVLVLNVLGWGVLNLVVVPQGLSVGNAGVFGLGLGVTAFLLGVRHAFDADHIAAVDNATRKLVGEGRHALSAGFWFSLGHSSVVFGLSLILAVGWGAVVGHVVNPESDLQQALGTFGAVVAGAFLVLIGLTNLAALSGIIGVLRGMRSGALDEAALERHLHNRGVIARVLARFTRRVRHPRHLYPIGLLMGLGLDTATQVALLVLAGGTAALALPWYAILVLPVLFAAGMTLFDALDGVLMTRMYQWAIDAPRRRVYYNLAVTVVSVLAALGIGGAVLLQVLAEREALSVPLAWAMEVNLDSVGFALVGLFVLMWLVSVAAGRLGRERSDRADGAPEIL
ncbi:MAG: HoxN/HupN/NixA family nickel/cobalt transporter [Actinomycetes bacterium]